MPPDKSKAIFNTTFRNWDFENIQALIQELNDILADMVRMESDNGAWIKNACPTYRNSARNMLHYLALRQRDIRGLQGELAAMGLSSLGRSESHVMANIIAVIKVLESLAGHDQIPASKLEPPADMISGKELLDLHTRGLLGESPPDRSAFIMVTMPSEAAEDYTVIRDLVESGMDCMRINCAHEDARAWGHMIDNLRRAETELNKKCRIFMDIAGNKVRMGPIESGLQILKITPK
ncbi:MAG TPA: pyruvate kinase, partial [Methanocellaceae archaeon]